MELSLPGAKLYGTFTLVSESNEERKFNSSFEHLSTVVKCQYFLYHQHSEPSVHMNACNYNRTSIVHLQPL